MSHYFIKSYFYTVVLLCAPDADEYRFLERAKLKGMTSLEYLWITLDHLPPANIQTPWYSRGNNRTDLIDVYKKIIQVMPLYILCLEIQLTVYKIQVLILKVFMFYHKNFLVFCPRARRTFSLIHTTKKRTKFWPVL